MKSPKVIAQTLQVFENRFQTGVDLSQAQQGSAIWHKLRLGVVTASNAYRAVAKKDSETRATYLAELVAQVCTGVPEEINSKHMDWGKQHEDAARAAYEFSTGLTVTQVPFVFRDETFRTGCSPDGIVSAKKGAEIKCPWSSSNYVKFLLDDKIKPEYVWQYQFTLWVMGAEEWDFNQYDPRMKNQPSKTVTVKVDPEKQKVLDEAIPAFLADMDKQLAKVGIAFGDQWKGPWEP